jgi:hypothetical protein
VAPARSTSLIPGVPGFSTSSRRTPQPRRAGGGGRRRSGSASRVTVALFSFAGERSRGERRSASGQASGLSSSFGFHRARGSSARSSRFGARLLGCKTAGEPASCSCECGKAGATSSRSTVRRSPREASSALSGRVSESRRAGAAPTEREGCGRAGEESGASGKGCGMVTGGYGERSARGARHVAVSEADGRITLDPSKATEKVPSSIYPIGRSSSRTPLCPSLLTLCARRSPVAKPLASAEELERGDGAPPLWSGDHPSGGRVQCWFADAP